MLGLALTRIISVMLAIAFANPLPKESENKKYLQYCKEDAARLCTGIRPGPPLEACLISKRNEIDYDLCWVWIAPCGKEFRKFCVPTENLEKMVLCRKNFEVNFSPKCRAEMFPCYKDRAKFCTGVSRGLQTKNCIRAHLKDLLPECAAAVRHSEKFEKIKKK